MPSDLSDNSYTSVGDEDEHITLLLGYHICILRITLKLLVPLPVASVEEILR